MATAASGATSLRERVTDQTRKLATVATAWTTSRHN